MLRIVVLLVSLSACGKRTDTPPTGDAPPAWPTTCDELVKPPPDATKLCDERVVATDSEIHWRSYASEKTRSVINDAYRARFKDCDGVSFTFKPPSFDVTWKGVELATYYAWKDDGHGGLLPDALKCSVSPNPAHNTVIVVSQRLRR